MKILIESLTFNTIIGVLKNERKTPQKIVVDAVLNYQYESSDSYLDYAEISALIEQVMQKEKFLLLEDAILELIKKLKEAFPLIDTGELKITKPDIMPNFRASVQKSFSFL